MEMTRRSFVGGLLALLAAPFAARADTPADPIPDPIGDPIGDPTGLTVEKIRAARDALEENLAEAGGDFHVIVSEEQYEDLMAEVEHEITMTGSAAIDWPDDAPPVTMRFNGVEVHKYGRGPAELDHIINPPLIQRPLGRSYTGFTFRES